jgi:hypothetical protein
MRRIFSIARKHGFQSLLIEELNESNCERIAADNADLSKRQPDFTHATIRRYSFFKNRFDAVPSQQDFIGCVIFRSDFFSGLAQPQSHVYEALIASSRGIQENNFIHCARTYDFNNVLGRFSQRGVLYARQNNKTFVCAHVALRTAIATMLPEGDITYQRINQLAGVDHASVQVGQGRGLSPGEMENVLKGLNIHYKKHIHEPSQGLNLPTDYQNSHKD